MPRFHFNIRNGSGFTRDEEGVDLSSAMEAQVQAIKGARSLMSAEILDGQLDLVTDEQDDPVVTVRFSDAVHVQPGEPAAAAAR